MPSLTHRSWPLPLLSVVIYWLALPPLNLWPLVVLAPAIWCYLIRLPRLPGKRPYLTIWAASFVFWLATTYWITFPHPALIVAWVALALYLSIYLPLFIGICRTSIFRFRIKPMVAAPVVWVAVEYSRKHFLGGFSFASLEHALYQQPYLIQIADLGGEYLVGMLIVFLGCGLACLIPMEVDPTRLTPRLGFFSGRPTSGRHRAFEPFLLGILLLAGTLIYGHATYHGGTVAATTDTPARRIAVLQGNRPITLGMDMAEAEDGCRDFIRLSLEAALPDEQGMRPDLIVWPETVYPWPLLEFKGNFVPREWQDLPPEEAADRMKETLDRNRSPLRELAARTGVPLLIGLSTGAFTPERGEDDPIRLNSALLVDPRQGPKYRYDKVHLVMFGEYIPFGEWIPRDFPLRSLCPEAGRGTGPVVMNVPPNTQGTNDTGNGAGPPGKFYVLPNICFESTVPHFIRRQVAALRSDRIEPTVLVNLSNDGWFRFTPENALHLAGNVFRAVEQRKPVATASNGGISALIDSRGVFLAQGRRGASEVLVATLRADNRVSAYSNWGDTYAVGCLFCAVFLAASHFFLKTEQEQTIPKTLNF